MYNKTRLIIKPSSGNIYINFKGEKMITNILEANFVVLIKLIFLKKKYE